jgi:DNA repair protein RadC
MARNTGIPSITVARSVELTAHHPSDCPEPLRAHRRVGAQQTAQMRQIWPNMAVFFEK